MPQHRVKAERRQVAWFAAMCLGSLLLTLCGSGQRARSEPGTQDGGEVQREHWAFQPVRHHAIPPAENGSWPQSAIDRFVLHRLEAQGLAPSAAADRRTLIRRLTYTLTGLPPTYEDVEAFVKDDTPDAYVRLIDRLLASPRYGEQWGRHWLDVARYSDTKGYVYARENRQWVHAWAYRDWVVQALNGDLPYDEFLRLQIAADQFAPEDRRSWAAMGFVTLGRRFLGVTQDIIDDRIDVVTRATMALTVACARCHDHKYDPIPSRDYYSLYGVFQNCLERPVPIEPPTGDAAFMEELEKREKKLADTLTARRAEASDRVRARVGDYLNAQMELHKYPDETFNQILTKNDLLPGVVRKWQTYLELAALRADPIFVPWHAYAGIDEGAFAERSDAVTRDLTNSADSVNRLVMDQFTTSPVSMREVAERYGRLFQQVDQEWVAKQAKAVQEGKPPPGELADPAAEAIRSVLYAPLSPCVVPDLAMVNIEWLFDTSTCEEIWKVQSEVDQWLIDAPSPPAYAMVLNARQPIIEPRVFLRGNPANRGETVPRQFLQLIAGSDRQPFSSGSGRRELAEAIVAADNPLTARVIVNRVWMHHFGEGLVTTPSDFGTRAQRPSHPELLDWLATRFTADGGSLKQLHRAILMSSTFQQDVAGPRDKATLAKAGRIDPANRLLWRFNRHRLTWEELRDSLLMVSDTLDGRMGGKPGSFFESGSGRRTIYALVDRQYLPPVFRTFDFANPDLHISQRAETTIPQQALFFMNHPFVAQRARSLASRSELRRAHDLEEQIKRMYHAVFQREPTSAQIKAAEELLRTAESASENADDVGEETEWLNPWEQLAQVLLLTNEFMFVD